MKQANSNFNASEMPILANRILSSFKRDRSYFEQYSQKFNYEFLNTFEEKVNTLINLADSQTFNGRISQTKEKIETIICNFDPLLEILQAYLRRNYPITGIRINDFRLFEVREVLNKKCVWEIRRSCQRLINRLEANIEDFIDKGFILVLISDFHFLIQKLNKMEDDLAEAIHLQGMVTDEFRYVDNQVIDLINTIIESTPAVFGEDDRAKRDDYEIEKMMIQTQFNRSDIQ